MSKLYCGIFLIEDNLSKNVLFYISLTNHRELSPFDCVLFYVICLVVVMYLCLLFVYL